MSRYLQVAQESGVGLGALYITSFLITGHYFGVSPLASGVSVAIVAIIPPFVVWALSKQFNKQLVDRIAGEKVAEAFVLIKYNQGGSRFYSEYDGDVQEDLDELDEKFHYQVINILSAAVISTVAVVFPIAEFSTFGIVGIVTGLAVSLIVAYGIAVASYRQMMDILEFATKVTKVKDEA